MKFIPLEYRSNILIILLDMTALVFGGVTLSLSYSPISSILIIKTGIVCLV